MTQKQGSGCSLAAPFSGDNVPYRPASRLSVSPDGLAPGDAVLLLGFPGHTMRYAPSARLGYADAVAVPRHTAEFAEKLALIKKYVMTCKHKPYAKVNLKSLKFGKHALQTATVKVVKNYR